MELKDLHQARSMSKYVSAKASHLGAGWEDSSRTVRMQSMAPSVNHGSHE